jgi:hypothetical protein
MGTDDWKKKTQSYFDGYMRYLKERTGSISSSSFFKTAGNFEYFKWIGEKKTLIVGLSASSAQTFSDINFDFFISPAELSAIPTDNPLKNAIDSGVNEVATRFMVVNSAVGMAIGIIKWSGPDQFLMHRLKVSFTYSSLQYGTATTICTNGPPQLEHPDGKGGEGF